MSERTLKQLVGALVIAVGIWLVASLFSGGGGGISASGEIADFFEGVDEESVTAFSFAGSGGSVEVTRDGDAWRANGFDASPGTMGRFFTALGSADVGDLSATNPNNHERMGLTADSAVTFTVSAGGETRTMLLGDQGPRFGTVYGRLPDADEVYVIEGDLRGHARRLPDDWRDTEIIVVDTTMVARVEIERDGDAYTIVRGDSAWTFEDGQPTDRIQVSNVLTELSSVIAAGFLAEGDSIYATPQGGSNTAYDTDGNVLAQMTIGTGDGERWVRSAGDSITYRLSAFRVGRLAPTFELMEPGS